MSLSILAAGIILAAVQFVAALPWLWVIDPKAFGRAVRSPAASAYTVAGLIAAGALIGWYISYKSDSTSLEQNGRYVYGAILHLQLIIGVFLLLPPLLTAVWPKAGAVAYAAFRESCRQPMFWVIIIFAVVATWLAVILPYFTFGDDYKMMKQIGFDIVMLAAILFGVLASSMSISEEIEGRTAVTVMSKPINRRQFLIGKYLGILMACLLMTGILGWDLNFALRVMPEFDKISETVDPMPQQAELTFVPLFERLIPAKAPAALVVARGAGGWFADTFAHSLGLLLGFGQVMILVAIAAALATRVPFVVNLVLCLVIYFLGHLAPVVVAVTQGSSGAGLGLVSFLGRLFDVLLPALEFFNMGPAIIRESPLDLWQFAGYVLTVFGYSVIYTAIALLVGLLLFEDRDLA